MNVAVTRAADGLPRRAFTVADVRRMIDIGILSEDERVELIEGDFVMMAAKGYAHDLIKNALTKAIARALADEMMIGVEMTIQFNDNTIVEPDLAVFNRASLVKSDENFSYIRPGQLLLAIEVAASSLAYDRGQKARLYARNGVRELWVIDANKRITWVHIGPTENGWSSIVERTSHDNMLTTPVVPGFSFRLSDVD